MPKLHIPTRSFSELYHVGTLNICDKRKDSHEGTGLSVSLHPDEWRRIGKGMVGGDTFILSKPKSRFLDAHAFRDIGGIETVKQWALVNGLVSAVQGWSMTWEEWEDEVQTYTMFFESKEQAEREAEDCDGIVKEIELLSSTPEMKARLERDDVGHALVEDLLLTLWVEDNTDLDGVWWEDHLNIHAFSAPRGVIIAKKLGGWDITPQPPNYPSP
jgi:hypothetical protein